MSFPYTLVGIAALAVIGALLVFGGRGRGSARLSRLAALAFAVVVAGAVFGDNRLVGYGLMGVGVLIAVVDIVLKSRGRV